MPAATGETTIDEAIKICLDMGSRPECPYELSELLREQEHLLENKYLLYKMIIRHLIKGAAAGPMKV